MDLETIMDAFGVSAVIVILLVVGAAAIYYMITKRKKDYHVENGIPELKEEPKEKEGSTDQK